MKKFSIALGFGLLVGIAFTSCKKCSNCSAIAEQYWNDTLVSTSSVSDQEICGDDLKAIKKNPEVVTKQTAFGIEQKVVVKYTCD